MVIGVVNVVEAVIERGFFNCADRMNVVIVRVSIFKLVEVVEVVIK